MSQWSEPRLDEHGNTVVDLLEAGPWCPAAPGARVLETIVLETAVGRLANTRVTPFPVAKTILASTPGHISLSRSTRDPSSAR